MNEQDQALCLRLAFRYVLGRSSHVTCDVSSIIKKNAHILKDWSKNQMINDIEFAVEHGRAGDKCDVDIWKGLKEFLTNEKTKEIK